MQRDPPQHTTCGIPPLNTPKAREDRILGYFSGIFGVFLRFPSGGELRDVGLVVLAYFGVSGVFCSVAGSWVVEHSGPLPHS